MDQTIQIIEGDGRYTRIELPSYKLN